MYGLYDALAEKITTSVYRTSACKILTVNMAGQIHNTVANSGDI